MNTNTKIIKQIPTKNDQSLGKNHNMFLASSGLSLLSAVLLHNIHKIDFRLIITTIL